MKRFIVIFILFTFWGLSVNVNNRLNGFPLNRKDRMSAVITSPEVKPFMLGYHSVLADYIWIRTMLYFGEHYQKGDLPWIKQMINSVILLNPGFFPPYEFSGIMIPELRGDYEYARETLSHGIGRVNRGEERLCFYLAYINYTHYKDKIRAADLFSYAATAEYAPPFWGKFAASLYRDAGDKDQGLTFLYALYESTESPHIKEQLEKKILDLLDEKSVP